MFISALGRVIWLPIAFLISAVISVLVLLTLGQEHVTRAMHVQQTEGDSLVALFVIVREAFVLTSSLTFLPALLLVVIGEVGRIRSVLYYVIGGGVALAAVPIILRLGQSEALSMPAAVVWQVFATAGFAGGFVYWLIAGRRA